MHRTWLCLLAFALVSVAPGQTMGAESATVTESARKIPVAYDVDVVVVGGSTGAVAAAVEAARNGASVFLAAPRPYLGEDVCGTLRLWLEEGETPENALEKAVFEMPGAAAHGRIPESMRFTYEADLRSTAKHIDTDPPRMLSDGKASDAPKQSVQYDGDVTIVADLGRARRIRSAYVLAYQRPRDFEVDTVTVWTSEDRRKWTQVATAANRHLQTGGHEGDAIDIGATFDATARYVKLRVAKTKRANRILLGEIILAETVPAAAPVRGVPTPMHVKRALDQALLDAGVSFLYGCAPTDVLFDALRPAGIVMANRAGRQAVVAKVIIDATDRATVARMADTTFRSYPPGPQTFRRVVVGGKPRTGEGVYARTLPFSFPSPRGRLSAIEYTLTIPMKDGSFASFAAAEQIARDRTFDPAQADASDLLFQVPPDRLVSFTFPDPPREGVVPPQTNPFRLANDARLYILGAAMLSVDEAKKLLRPLAFMRAGRRVGASAARDAKDLPKPHSPHVPATRVLRSGPGEVREELAGLRPTATAPATVPSGPRALPVLGEYDVVVIGGGTGGAPAGIAAARSGAKTLVVEYQCGLGGVGTLGMISNYYWGYRKGFTAEVDRGVAAMKAPKVRKGWNIQAKQEWWRSELRKAGADIWFATLGCGALVEGNRVTGAVVATPHGRGVVRAKVVIDSTGNADIAAAAGAACITTGAEHVAMQGTGLPPRNLAVGYTNTDYSFVTESDPVDAWRMLVTAKRKFPDAYDVGPFIDSRERRRIVGDAFVTPLDILNNRTYGDTIAIHHSNFDTHGFTVHPMFALRFPDKSGATAHLPYRCLLPKGLDGILVTGLGVSAHRDAMPILRMQPCVQNQGYAAGTAAAMAAKDGRPTRSVEIAKLQKHLVKTECLPPDVPAQSDSFPMSDAKVAAAVKDVVNHFKGLETVLAKPDTALPLLRKAYARASSPADRLTYANILGMMGDATGIETLLEAVATMPWDKGWNFKGMGQFGGSLSRVDSLIISLGRTGDKRALGAIIEKARQLDASKEFSHHRAVAMALETLRDPAAASALADLLSKPDMTGYAMTDVKAAKAARTEHRSQPLRELILARALYICGDRDDVARKILEQYRRDLRGLFARHAHAVLHRK
jgi:hypothetical protein